MLAKTEDKLPIVNEKNPTPKIIQITLKMSSVFVRTEMSPYPTVVIVYRAQYNEVKYR
jgi:hypothetical protein